MDTPGFGDTSGIKQDEKITEQIRTFLNASGVAGIDHIDAICLLAQAGIPRHTQSQLNAFDKILSMFGKDIQENISVLFTFADGQKPQALSSLLEAGILDTDGKYFKFNNSALFEENCQCDEENFDQMFWSMGIENFKKFFKSLNGMESKSLVLTREVLQERERLEMTLSSLQYKINSLSLLQEKKLVTVEKQYDSKKTLYQKPLKSRSISEALTSPLEYEFNETEKIVFRLLAEMQPSLQRLSKIALKGSPLQQTDYLDLLIKSEKMQGKPGFERRVRTLRETRNRAEQINKMAKPGYDPWLEYKETGAEQINKMAKPDRDLWLEYEETRAEQINKMAKPGYEWVDEMTRMFFEKQNSRR